nr:hypothetical transcript [Hymenolepis microstoma]
MRSPYSRSVCLRPGSLPPLCNRRTDKIVAFEKCLILIQLIKNAVEFSDLRSSRRAINYLVSHSSFEIVRHSRGEKRREKVSFPVQAIFLCEGDEKSELRQIQLNFQIQNNKEILLEDFGN